MLYTCPHMPIVLISLVHTVYTTIPPILYVVYDTAVEGQK